MKRRNISSGSALEPAIGFSRAVRVGAHIGVAGTAPIAADGEGTVGKDAYQQTKRCLEIVAEAITAAGGAFSDVTRTRVMLSDIANWQHAARAHGECSFTGRIYERPEVTLGVAEARSFVEASRTRWDLIQLALLDSRAASAAGVQALSESPMYTIEALQAYLDHLNPGGLVAITRWLGNPPRDTSCLPPRSRRSRQVSGAAPAKLIRGSGWCCCTAGIRPHCW